MSIKKDGSFVYDKDMYSCLCVNVLNGVKAGQKWFVTPEKLCEYIKQFLKVRYFLLFMKSLINYG